MVGINYFLTKPVSSDKLLRTIAQATEHLETTQFDTDIPVTNVPDNNQPEEIKLAIVDQSILSQVKDLAPDESFLVRLFDNFSADSREILIGMQEAATSCDTTRYRALAHALKGSSLNLGLLELSSLAADSEKIPDTGFPKEAMQNMTAVRASMDRARSALSKLLGCAQPAVY